MVSYKALNTIMGFFSSCSNRTFMELKLQQDVMLLVSGRRSNRTFMELKSTKVRMLPSLFLF